jgi:hypothetical protein
VCLTHTVLCTVHHISHGLNEVSNAALPIGFKLSRSAAYSKVFAYHVLNVEGTMKHVLPNLMLSISLHTLRLQTS